MLPSKDVFIGCIFSAQKGGVNVGEEVSNIKLQVLSKFKFQSPACHMPAEVPEGRRAGGSGRAAGRSNVK